MKTGVYFFARRLGFFACFSVVVSQSIFAQGFSPQTIARLQRVIDSFQTNPANPYVGGISAAIKVDGLASWQGVTGYAARNIDGANNLLTGGTAFTKGTVSQIYSVTKSFTAPLVLELAKEGVFSLEDPVSMYLPLNLINADLNGAVTIRQLLAHESGYSNYTDEFMLQLAVAFQPAHVWTPFEMLTFVHQINAPGTVRRYSSTNYITLGAIIEAVTGKPVEQYYRDRFFEPLALSSMYLSVRESLPNGTAFASPHDNISAFNPIFQLTGQPVFPNTYTNISAFPFTAILSLAFTGGGIASNVSDMADWSNALFGGRATSPSTLSTMMNSISSTPDPDGDFLGYGIFRTTRISPTDKFIGHDGNAPGYRSVMFYQPERKMTIAILTNYGGAKLYDVAKALYAALPQFLCGNEKKKENKIIVCYNGNNLCIDRHAAAPVIEKGGYLGNCEAEPITKTTGKLPGEVESFNTEITGMKVFPNPAAGNVSVLYKVKQSGKVNFSLYDITGKLVANIFNGMAEKGIQQKIEFETGNLSAGVYVGYLKTADGTSQQKIILARQ